MNLPNKLTVLRVILVPFFVFFLLGADWIGSFSPYIALIIFIVASLTDMLDGKIARKYNLITNFGKFMDPLADKLLVCSALICFVDMHRMPTWVVIIIIAREFIISGFRLVAAEGGTVIAACLLYTSCRLIPKSQRHPLRQWSFLTIPNSRPLTVLIRDSLSSRCIFRFLNL